MPPSSPLRLLGLAFALWSITAWAEVPSVYSHFQILPVDKAHIGRPVDPEEVVANVEVIRPIAQLGSPPMLESRAWEPNRREALEWRKKLRVMAEQQYRLHGVLPKEGPLPERVVRDLDNLLRGDTAIIAIFDPKDSTKLLQLVSVAYGKPLPLQETLRGLIPPAEELPHRYERSEIRFVEAFGTLFEIPVISAMVAARPAVEGDTIEIKTFIQGYRSHEDWIPTILRMLVSLDLIRNGTTPLTAREQALRPGETPKDVIDRTVARMRPYYSEHETDENLRWRVENYVQQPNFQKTVRVSRIRIEAIGDELVELYTKRYGLVDTGTSAMHPELKQVVHVLEQDRAALESYFLEGINRRGLANVEKYGYVPAPVAGSRGEEGACLSHFSQLGRELPAVLNTRGTQFPFRI
jgi:hypothetical protein